MKWVLRAFVVIAALIAVVLGVGYLLPVEHSATVVRDISAGPEMVWTVLTDVEAMPQWRSGLDAVELLADKNGLPSWTERSGSQEITFDVVEWESPRLLVTRIADEGLPFGGGWRVQMEPVGEVTRVTITESGEVYSAVYRFVSRFVIGHDATMVQYLADLERHLTAG